MLVLLGDQLGTAYQAAQLAQGKFAPAAVTVSDLFAGAMAARELRWSALYDPLSDRDGRSSTRRHTARRFAPDAGRARPPEWRSRAG